MEEDTFVEKQANFSIEKLELGAGEQPQVGNRVTVHYTAKLKDGTMVDSSVSRGEPFSFTMGVGEVIKGWDIGIADMKKGEKARIICPPDYAYGAAGL